MNASVETEDFIRNVRWKPLRFKWSNMFSYGEDNVVDFEKTKGALGIFAPNATGKSALMDSITFCLFDKTTREFKPVNIMNNKSKYFECEISFLLDSKIYNIKRVAKKDKSNRLIYKVDFWATDEDGKNKVNLNGENRWETNKNIKSKIGNFEDFILSTYSVQDNSTGFIDRGHSERKDLIIEFVGLGLFDSLYELAAVQLKDIQNKLKILQSKNLSETLNKLEIEYVKIESEYDDLVNEKELHSIELKEKESEIKRLDNMLVAIDNVNDIDELEKEKIQLKKLIDEYTDAIKSEESSILDIIEKINKLENSIKIYNGMNITKLYDDLINLENDKSNIESEMKSLRVDIENKLEKLKKLGKLEYDPNCKYCMNNIFVKDAIKTKKDLDEYKNKYVDIKTRFENIQSIIESKKDINVEYNKYKDQMNAVSALKNKLDLEKQKYKMNTDAYDNIKYKIEINKKNIEKYRNNEKIILKNEKISEEIDKLESENLKIKNILNELSDSILKKYADLRVDETKIENVKNEIIELKDATKEYDIYKYYTDSIRRDGIPYDIISKIAPIIEYEVNNILAQIVNFSILIELDDSKNINTYIAYDDNRIWPLELSSGMEKFISSIAFRVALTNISNLPRPNFLIIDEGWGKLDSENLNSVNLLLDYLKTQFDFIMVISHIDEMKDMVDNTIEIKKDKSGNSKIMHII